MHGEGELQHGLDKVTDHLQHLGGTERCQLLVELVELVRLEAERRGLWALDDHLVELLPALGEHLDGAEIDLSPLASYKGSALVSPVERVGDEIDAAADNAAGDAS